MEERVLHLILDHLPLEDRLLLAQMDTEMHKLIMKWTDVDSVLIDQEKLFLGSTKQPKGFEKSIENIEDDLKEAVEKFGNLSRIVVQKKMSQSELQILSAKGNLKKLYISSGNFKTEPLSLSSLKNLRSLNILQRYDQPVTFSPVLPPDALPIGTKLRRLSLTGLLLPWETVKIIFSLPALRSLDLVGCAVETATMKNEKLESPPDLDEISLPPSWFSFSTENVNSFCKTDFKWLKASKVCVYMVAYDKKQFWADLKRFSIDMEVLVLHGNYAGLKQCDKFKEKRGFQVLFGPSAAQAMDFPWCPSTCSLLSHYVRRPPYAFESFKQFIYKWSLDVQKATTEQKEKKKGEKGLFNRGIPLRPRVSANNRRRRRTTSRRRAASPDMVTAISPSRNQQQAPQNQPMAQADVLIIPQQQQQQQQQEPQQPPVAGEPSDDEVIEALVDMIMGRVARDMEAINNGNQPPRPN